MIHCVRFPIINGFQSLVAMVCLLVCRIRSVDADWNGVKIDFANYLVLLPSLIDGKGFGFKRMGGFKGGHSRGSGIFGGSSGYNRGTSYGGYMGKP